MACLPASDRQSMYRHQCRESSLRAQEDDTQHTMDDWAPAAHLEFRGVSAAYGIGLDPVLKNISFCLEV